MEAIKIKKIYRSRRRTIALEITPLAELIVRAPYSIPEYKIFDFVNLKRAWILVKQKFVSERLGKRKERKFLDGEEILFLGKPYPLKITAGAKIFLSDYLEFPGKFLKAPEKHLADWYRLNARKIITERCEYFARQMGLRYSAIRINGAKKRLGSCSSSNSLNFTWLLMLAPPRVIDYVVVHELSHIVIKNHSPRFWNKVSAFWPSYREERKWLKENSCKLI
jgi:hypothetical protein